MPEESKLWTGVDNYTPFLESEAEVDSLDAVMLSDNVFCLGVDIESAGNELVEKSRMLAEFDDDTAFISVMSGSDGESIFGIALSRAMREQGGILATGKGSSVCKLYAGACNGGNHGLFVLNNALMLLYALFTAGRNTLLIHASVAVKEGKGYEIGRAHV